MRTHVVAGKRRTPGPGLLALLLLGGVACGGGRGEAEPRATGVREAGSGKPRRLEVEVVAEWPHDPAAFTQGLLWHRGRLYESTGQYGASSLREVAVETGEVLRRVELPAAFFGEGLARVGERLVLLTWREETALVFDLESFEERRRFRYQGQGWGLCHHGGVLYQSDGTPRLTRRSADDFRPLGTLQVTRQGRPVPNLNELECVAGDVWANLWMGEEIVRIDAASGVVTASVDASSLRGRLAPEDRARADVLNGIAHNPESGTFYLTGKYWPVLFEVVFVPGEGAL